MRKYKLSCFIGRFSPPHRGHLAVIEQALLVADIVLIAIGSANAARSYHYVPFTAAERETMIRLMLTAEQNVRVRFVHVEDQGNMQKWTAQVRKAANAIEIDNNQITLIGHSKDRSSYYLKGFRGWHSTDVDNYMGLSATTFRNMFFFPNITHDAFSTNEKSQWDTGLSQEVSDWLWDFSQTNLAYEYLIEERIKVAEDQKKYGKGPFLTGDAVVIQGDHVLLIERGNYPYKGCLAFPGGFVESDERVVDAIFRELDEETGPKVPDAVLRKALKRVDYWDNPWRDPRGRVVSWSGLIVLNPMPPESMTDPKEIEKFLALPRVKAKDDAKRAFWTPIADVRRDQMAFDHYLILQHALDQLEGE